MMPFMMRLQEAIRSKGTPLVVGIDPHLHLLPDCLLRRWSSTGGDPFQWISEAVEEFCLSVIDRVAPLVPAVKVQSAFFERLGPLGMVVMGRVLSSARDHELLVICDVKRNDIGSTARGYAEGFLGAEGVSCSPDQKWRKSDDESAFQTLPSPWASDAITVNPYLGGDSLDPFVQVAERSQAGIFVLVKTSNPGSKDFQDLDCSGSPLYLHVADKVEQLSTATRGSGPYGAVGAVVGATFPKQVAELRARMPHTWILLPGFGAQGAGSDHVRAAFDAKGSGAVVNSSRAILFSFRNPPYADHYGEQNWQDAVLQATRDSIEQLSLN